MDLNSKCLLTWQQEGAPVQATGVFVVKKMVDGIEVRTTKYAKNISVPGVVTHKTMLSEAFVQHSVSNDGIVEGFSKYKWGQLSKPQRLRANLKEVAGQEEFNYELI